MPNTRIPLNPVTLGALRRRASVVCPRWPTSVRVCQRFAHGLSSERDRLGMVHEPVKNGVGQRRLTDGPCQWSIGRWLATTVVRRPCRSSSSPNKSRQCSSVKAPIPTRPGPRGPSWRGSGAGARSGHRLWPGQLPLRSPLAQFFNSSYCVYNVYTLGYSCCVRKEDTMVRTGSRATAGRSETINLRASQKQKGLIDRAAGALGKSRSDFMLETVCREAEAVLLDQRYFALSQDAFKRFTAMLDTPPTSNLKLRCLLQQRAPWER